MLITNYATVRLERDLAANPGGQACRFVETDRREGKLYLYNSRFQLVKILELASFGVVDKRRKIPHKDRFIEVADGPRASTAAELGREFLCVWHEELGLTLFDFDGTPRFHLDGAVCHAQYDPRNNLLWTARRDSDRHITLLVYDYQGVPAAALPMEDPLFRSDVSFRPLPERNAMAVSLAAGQDGSQDYFLELDRGELAVTQTLPGDLTYLFHQEDGREGIFLDFYDMALHRRTLPGLGETGRFDYPVEEWSIGPILPLNSRKLALGNDCDGRYYLFDIPSMSLGEEIVLQGYEPVEDGSGIPCTGIQEASLLDGRLLFHARENRDGRSTSLRLVCENFWD